jgi:hypothetical protein
MIPVVGAISEVAVSLIQVQSQMNVAVSFLCELVYYSGSSSARLYNQKSVGMIDTAANRLGVTAA